MATALGQRRAGSRSRASLRAVFVAFALSSSSCATYSERLYEAHVALEHGRYDSTLEQLNRVLKVDDSNELPRKWKKNYELVVLERATVLQAIRDYDTSARDFRVADKQLELLDIARDGAGQVGKYIYSDAATKYKTSPVEKLAINAMNMANYLAMGDLGGAKVEAKRFTVMRNYLRDTAKSESGAANTGDLAFGSYLAGFVYEHLGDADEALRYYDEALEQPREGVLGTLQEPVARLFSATDFRGTHLKALFPSASAPAAPREPSENTGEILVLAKVGRVPYKEPRRIPIGAAIGIAGAFITGDPTLLEYGMFKVVTYPELVSAPNVYDRAWWSLDGEGMPMDLASDLATEVIAEHEQLKPKIIGAALTRMIARAAAAEGARAAGNQAEGAGGLIGFLAAAAIEGTLVALDKPDTRSWTTLPARVFIGRARVPAGTHQVKVNVAGPGGSELRTHEVKVPAGGFVVVDVTTLR